MRPLLLLLLALPFFATAQSGVDQQILDTEQRRFETMVRKDTAALRDLLSDDLVYIHSNTMTESKSAHLTSIGSGKIVYEKMTREQAKVRRYGKTALSNGVVQVKVSLDGKPVELRLMYTATYLKKRGAWRLVNWQSTRIP